jgi:hypothetical protein
MIYLKSYRIFEAYPASKFEIDSENLFKELKEYIDEILLELSDSGIEFNINKYIDDIIFEFQVQISSLQTTEQKQICEDVLLRIETVLEKYGIHLDIIQMQQLETNYKHDFDLYSMSEIENLKDSAGDISLLVIFSKDNY